MKVYFLNFGFLNKIASNTESTDTHHRIIDNNIEEIQNQMVFLSGKALFNLENKNKILARTEKEIFKALGTETPKDKKKKELLISSKNTVDDLFKSYIKYEKEKSKTSNNRSVESSLRIMKPKLLKHISQFTNNFMLQGGEKEE